VINHKRMFRIMRQNGMLLARNRPQERSPPRRQGVVMGSNLRWCSDGFEIACWNGDILARN
jgi:hypothetical protein